VKKLKKPAPKKNEPAPAAAPAEHVPPLFVRLDGEQRGALEAFLADLNAKRDEAGLRATKLGTWARDELLRAIGRADLTAAGKMKREMEIRG
jgi:hypothetical protein